MLISELEELAQEDSYLEIEGKKYQIFKDPHRLASFPYQAEVDAWWSDGIDTNLDTDEVYTVGDVKVRGEYQYREFELLCNGTAYFTD